MNVIGKVRGVDFYPVGILVSWLKYTIDYMDNIIWILKMGYTSMDNA